MRVRPPTLSGVALGAVVVLIVTAATATAAALITSADIKNNTVASVDLKNNNIVSADIKDGTISSADIKNNIVASADIKDGAHSDRNHRGSRPQPGCSRRLGAVWPRSPRGSK